MKLKKILSVSLLGMLLSLASLTANAVPVVCADPLADGMGGGSGSGGAHDATSSIDPLLSGATIMTDDCFNLGKHSESIVNDGGGLYGITDWSLRGKDEGDDSIIDTGFGETSGTFSFADLGANLYLIVLKFDGVFAAFKSDMNASEWAWNTDVDGNGKFGISNLAVYTSGGSTRVPEPGSLALLGAGLIGFGLMRRKRRSAA